MNQLSLDILRWWGSMNEEKLACLYLPHLHVTAVHSDVDLGTEEEAFRSSVGVDFGLFNKQLYDTVKEGENRKSRIRSL